MPGIAAAAVGPAGEVGGSGWWTAGAAAAAAAFWEEAVRLGAIVVISHVGGRGQGIGMAVGEEISGVS